jgi:hypothetical protein
MLLLTTVILMGLVAPLASAFAQKLPAANDESKLTDDERRQRAHSTTLQKFNELKAARAAQEKAECEGTAAEKDKANKAYRSARADFDTAVDREALLSEASMKAHAALHEANSNSQEADRNRSISDEYRLESHRQAKKAADKSDEVFKTERARVLRDYATLLDELEKKCPPKGQTMVPGGRTIPVGGGYYERMPGISPDGNSGVRFLVSAEGGFAGARAFYDDLSIDPRSFIGGVSVGVRSYQPNNMFLGAQVGVLGTDLTREAEPGLSVGLRWQVPVDIQVGRTFQTGAKPVSVYGFVGPMWGVTRVSSFGETEYFTLFGVTAGVGLEMQLNQNWAVGAKARAFTLGPSDRRSDGQHVEGGSVTGSLSYRF